MTFAILEQCLTRVVLTFGLQEKTSGTEYTGEASTALLTTNTSPKRVLRPGQTGPDNENQNVNNARL